MTSLFFKSTNWCCLLALTFLCNCTQLSHSFRLHSMQITTPAGTSSTESSSWQASHRDSFKPSFDNPYKSISFVIKKFFWIPSNPVSGTLNSALHIGHIILSPGSLSCPTFSRHPRQKVWMHGNILGSEYSSAHMQHSSKSLRESVDGPDLDIMKLQRQQRFLFQTCFLIQLSSTNFLDWSNGLMADAMVIMYRHHRII